MACASRSFSLLDLPLELLAQVFSHLHQHDGLRAAAACRLLRQVATDINRKAGWRPRIMVALSGQARILDVSDLLFCRLPEPLISAVHRNPRRSKGGNLTPNPKKKKGSNWFTSITVPKEQPRTLYVCQYRVRGIIQFALLPRLRYQRQTASDTLLQEPEGVVITNNFLYVQTNWGVLNRCSLEGAIIEHRYCGNELVTWCLVEGPDGALYCSADEFYETEIYTEAPATTTGMVLRWALHPGGALPDKAEPFTKTRIKRPCGLNFGSSCGTLFVTSMDGFVHRFAGPQHQHAGTHLSVIQLTPGPSITLDLPGPSGSVTTALPQHGAEGVLAGGVADHSLALSTTVLQPWQNTGGQGPELPPNVLPWDVLAVKGNTLIISMHKNSAYTRPKKVAKQAKQPSPVPQRAGTRKRAQQQQQQQQEQQQLEAEPGAGAGEQHSMQAGGQEAQRDDEGPLHGQQSEQGSGGPGDCGPTESNLQGLQQLGGSNGAHAEPPAEAALRDAAQPPVPSPSSGDGSRRRSAIAKGSEQGDKRSPGPGHARQREPGRASAALEEGGVAPDEACYLVMVENLGEGPMRVVRLPDWVDHASCMCAAEHYMGPPAVLV